VPPVFGAVWEAVRIWSETVTYQDFETFKKSFIEDYARE